MKGLFDILNHSLFLYPVLVCAIVAVVISVERLFFLVFQASVASETFYREVQRRILAGEIDQAIRYCGSAPRAPLANVVKAALLHADAPREDLGLAIEQASLDAVPAVQRRVGYLAMLANVVTLFGLLGTIVGLIRSFDAVAQADPDDKQTMLAAGIAMAMYTTAGGISVAIPTLIAYSVLVQRGNAILDDVERYGTKVMLVLLARARNARLGTESAPAEVAGATVDARAEG
ncbi:MAG: MotA/TolQ/ExbB proton channel family protein [Myxococcota bacterium]